MTGALGLRQESVLRAKVREENLALDSGVVSQVPKRRQHKLVKRDQEMSE